MSEEKRAVAPHGQAGADPDSLEGTSGDAARGRVGAHREHVGAHRRPSQDAADPAGDDEADRPATFREIMSVRPYRAIYSGTLLSWLGDSLTKAAVTVLVLRQTGSPAMSAAAFAIGFVPWVVGGPVLAALAERYPYRTIMITCDLLRASIVALVAIPGMPVPVTLALLFAAALLTPPFEAARSALLPRVLEGNRYVTAVVIQNITSQVAQLAGYALGAAIAAYNPHIALLIDAGTFFGSAALLALFVGSYLPSLERWQRTHLLRETGQGFRVVFGNDVLRSIAILIFTLMLFPTVIEGLAAAWAGQLSPKTRAGAGLDQAIIMAGYPIGFLIGGIIVGRLLRPRLRDHLIRPLAVLTPLVVVPALFNPPAPVIALLSMVCGFAVAGLVPPANGLFVRALPNAFRARAFGIMQSGVQIIQGVSVFACGALADRFALHTVVGAWSIAGVFVMGLISMVWPSQRRFARAFERADEINAAAAEEAGAHAQGAAGAPRVAAAESV